MRRTNVFLFHKFKINKLVVIFSVERLRCETGSFFLNKTFRKLLYNRCTILENVDNYGYWRLCLTEVESVTGITCEDILSRRTEECADARYILVYFLALRLTDNEIAKVSGMSRQRVNYLKNNFQWVRGKWSVRCKVKEVGDRLDGVDG